MIEPVARALARRARGSVKPDEIAGIHAALRAGGYDPETVEPDDPQGYLARSSSNGFAWNPGYLSSRELRAMIDAGDAARGGAPF